MVTVVGLEFGGTIAFSVVTESIFAWPGMGKLIIDSINVLDRPVIVAYLMIIVLMFIAINLVVDLTYSVLDPRVRLESKGHERRHRRAARQRSGRRPPPRRPRVGDAVPALRLGVRRVAARAGRARWSSP